MKTLNPPPDNVAVNAIVNVQTGTTRCKELIAKSVMERWDDKTLTKALNKVIAETCKDIESPAVREQTRKALVTSSKKWLYILRQSMQILNRNLAIKLPEMFGGAITEIPVKTYGTVRNLLSSGEAVGNPIIENYARQVKIALKAFATSPPEYAVDDNGKIRQSVLRNSAEATVRFEANLQDLQKLKDDGIKLVWTSSHASCSPRCAKFQGRLWSLDGTKGTIDGIPFSPLQEATRGENNDGNGIITGYNCRHRLIEYKKGSRPPKDYTESEIKKEYAIDQRQRAYENNIRQLKTEEMTARASGDLESAKALRLRWRRLTRNYEIYSAKQGRPYYPYRTVIDKDIEKQSLAKSETQ